MNVQLVRPDTAQFSCVGVGLDVTNDRVDLQWDAGRDLWRAYDEAHGIETWGPTREIAALKAFAQRYQRSQPVTDRPPARSFNWIIVVTLVVALMMLGIFGVGAATVAGWL